jgi:hypothetical protein
MNDIETLFRIIQRAEKNGFNFCEWQYRNTNIALLGIMEGNIKELLRTNYYKLLLLDKDFAIAFWGEKLGWYPHVGHSKAEIMKCHEARRQTLVLEDDLIGYYAQFLDNEYDT